MCTERQPTEKKKHPPEKVTEEIRNKNKGGSLCLRLGQQNIKLCTKASEESHIPPQTLRWIREEIIAIALFYHYHRYCWENEKKSQTPARQWESNGRKSSASGGIDPRLSDLRSAALHVRIKLRRSTPWPHHSTQFLFHHGQRHCW